MIVIYRLLDTTTGICYVGSTSMPLKYRISVHKCLYNKWILDDTQPYLYAFEVFKNNTVEASILEEVVNEIDRNNRERYHIEHTDNCINHNIPGRKAAEWHLTYREYHCKQMLDYYYNNKQEINKKIMDKYHNNTNGFRDKALARIEYNKIQKLIEYELDN